MRRLLAWFAIVAVWSIAASETRAFTVGAEVVTALALGAFVALSVTRNRTRRRMSALAPSDGSATPPAWTFVVWAVAVALVVGYELFTFVELPRAAHPTLSVAFSFIAAHAWSRGLAFFGWLALGHRLSSP